MREDRKFLDDFAEKKSQDDVLSRNPVSAADANIAKAGLIGLGNEPAPKAELVINSETVRRAELVVRHGTNKRVELVRPSTHHPVSRKYH
jgi:hypothetical protein